MYLSVKDTILLGTSKIGFSFIISLSTYLFSQFFLFESQYIPDGTSYVKGILCNSHCCCVYLINCNLIILAVISDTLSLSTFGTKILKSSICSIIPELIARLLNNSLKDIPMHMSLLSPKCENNSLACSILFPFSNANKYSK